MDNKFDFQEEKVIEEIKKRNCKKILIQLPEGLKMYTSELVSNLGKNCNVVVSGEPCWGGCDLAISEAKHIGADLIIHYGHSSFVERVDFPVLYIDMEDKTDIGELLEKSSKELDKYSKIGLVCSVQHISQLGKAKKFFEKLGKKVIIPKKSINCGHEGQIIGCNYNGLKTIDEEVEAFVVVGNRFHSLGAALAIKKPVCLLDVYNSEVLVMDELRDKIIKQRFAAIEKAKSVDKIGIIIGTKIGQKFGDYQITKDKFEKLGKKVIVITMNEINKDKLTNFSDIDVFVELACPRIAIEDYGRYDKTLITFKESLVVLNEIGWEEILYQGFI